MFNIDRWAVYTLQRMNASGVHFAKPVNRGIALNHNWFDMTSRQLRRCKKKANRRQDWSIGMLSRKNV